MITRFDSPDLERLVTDLAAAGAVLPPKLAGVAAMAGRRVAADARARINQQRTGRYLKHYPASITSELLGDGVEVGPDASKPQGGMGPGVEFGSVNHGPMPHLIPALEAEEPLFVAAVESAAAGVLG